MYYFALHRHTQIAVYLYSIIAIFIPLPIYLFAMLKKVEENNMAESEGKRAWVKRSHQDRRQHGDRREEIRFEPGKADRRKNRGRRKEDHDAWYKALDRTDSSEN